MDIFLWLLLIFGVGFVAYLIYTKQYRWLIGVGKNAALGVVGLLVFNFALGGFGLVVGINAITVLVVGVLGAPGFVLLYASQFLVG